jgi:hypothetical protein
MPSVSHAQRGAARNGIGPGMGGGVSVEAMVEAMVEARDPVGFLIEHSRELSLADDQVRALQGIRRELRAQNRPLADALEAVAPPGLLFTIAAGRRGEGGGPPGGRDRRPPADEGKDSTKAAEGGPAVPDTVRALLVQIRKNQEAARVRAMDVLSEDQQAQVAEVEAAARRTVEGRGGRPGGRGRRPDGA